MGWGERELKGKTHYFADFRDGLEVSREIQGIDVIVCRWMQFVMFGHVSADMDFVRYAVGLWLGVDDEQRGSEKGQAVKVEVKVGGG